MFIRYLASVCLLISFSLAAPIPNATSSSPGTQLIGESFSQELCLQNSGDAMGYQPQFEIVTPQGITMSSTFTYLGDSFSIKKSFTCNNSSCDISNDDTGVVTSLDENQSFYIIDYPLGSFPTSMLQQCIDVDFILSTDNVILPIAVPTDIKAIPLFSLGATAVDDGTSIYGSEINLTVIPNVFTISKTIEAIESETAIGENFPHTVKLDINVANGQSVTNIVIKDILPKEMYFKSMLDSDGCSVDALPDFNTTQLLQLTCPSVVGTTAVKEKTISFDFYIPKTDTLGNSVLNPVSGSSKTIVNNASATAVYDGNSVSDSANDTIIAKVFTAHKTMQIIEDNGIAGISPLDIVKYTIEMDVSDYFSIKDLLVDDNLSDAQLLIEKSPYFASYEIQQDGVVRGGGFIDGKTLLFKGFDTLTGSANYQFLISDASFNIPIDGDAIDGDYLQGATKVILNFDVQIQETHRAHGTINEKKVKAGDKMSNESSSHAKFPDGSVLPDNRSSVSDTVSVAIGEKSIYALNGSTTIPDPVVIAAGENLTYRIKMSFPINSFSELNVTDFLPAPLFDAGTFAANFDSSADSTPPANGSWKYGPDNTYLVPPQQVLKDATQNTILWYFTPQDSDNNTSNSTVLDILFTISVTDAPLADRLTLSNLASAGYDNSEGERLGGSDIITVITKQPSLSIEKKILSSSGGSGSTIEQTPGDTYNSLLHKGVGDESVNYEINVTNSGSNRAYDIKLEDIFLQNSNPTGLTNCTTPVISGADTPTSSRNANKLSIEAVSLDANTTMLITYTCDIDGAYTPGKDIINTATLKNYANNPNGPNFVQKVIDSKTKIDLKGVVSLDKDIYNTSLAETDSNSSLNRGELIDFNMSLVLSAGTYKNYQFIDSKCPTLTDFTYTNTTISDPDLVVSGGDGTISFTCKDYVATVSESNIITFKADNIPDISASVSWSVINPPVDTTKTMTPKKADAGDTIAGKFTWDVKYNSNSSNHPAYNCSVEDNLSTAKDFSGKVIYDFNSFAFTGAIPAGYSCSFDNLTGVISCHTDDNTTVCPNGEVDFSITTNADAVVGSSYPNIIKFEGKTLPEAHYIGSDTNEGIVKKEATGAFELNSPSKPIKKIIATSESATDDSSLDNKPPVAIGEVITYEIEFGFPEGVTKNVTLSDVLISEKWAQYIPNSFYIRKSSMDLNASSTAAMNYINLAAANTNISIPDTDLIFIPDSSLPKEIALELQNVQNFNVGATTSQEKYTIGLKYRVKNIATNTSANDKHNRGKLTFTRGDNTPKSLNSLDRQVRIVEPSISVRKSTQNGVTFEAEDIVKYSLEICNGSQSNNSDVATAFDINISDVLPIKLSGSNVVVSAPSGSIADATFSDSQHLIGVINLLKAGDCVDITYDALIDTSANYGEQLSNIVNIEATSLRGKYGDIGYISSLSNQNPGEENGERTGSGGVNYLHKQSHFTISIQQAGLVKSLLNYQNYYAIEDNATYEISVGAPKGSVNNFQVHDQLPTGLKLIGTPVVTTNFGNPPSIPTQSGALLVWDFGDFTATDNLVATIRYNVVVENVLSNQDGTVLQNSAKLQYDDPNTGGHIINGPVTAQRDVRIGEPNLYIQKNLTHSISKIQAGDIISYEVIIKNQGHTEAFDLNWSDILPQSLAQISNASLSLKGQQARRHDNNAVIQSSDLSTYTTDYGDGVSSNNSLKLPALNLPVGGEIHILFDSVVQSNLIAGNTLTNNTKADYKSMFDFGRNGADCGDDDDDTNLNNYCEKASESFKANTEVKLFKSLLLQKDEYTIGEDVIYKLRINIPQATLQTAHLVDKLPLGLTYVSHSISVGNGGISYGSSATDPITCTPADACEVDIDFTEIKNPDNGNRNDDYIDVELIARVENVLANRNKTVLLNGSSSDGISGSPVYFDYSADRIYFDSDSALSGYQGIAIEVVEPYLKIEKTVTPTTQTINDIITYHVKLYHTQLSQSDAYDLNFTDTLPVGIDFIPGSETNIKLSQNGRTLSANADMFPRNYGSFEFSYKAKIKASVDPTKTYYNDIELKYASIPDATGEIDSGRNGKDGAGWNELNNYVTKTRVGVMAGEKSDINVFKSVNRPTVSTSDANVTYTIVVENNGTLDVNITSMVDDMFGDITLRTGSTCTLPQEVYIGQSYSCSFDAVITGAPGYIHVNTVNVNAIDRAGNSSNASDKAYVRVIDAQDSVIGQRVFNDKNANGIMDRNEQGIDGVSIDLIDSSNGLVIQSHVTSNNGFYLFEHLNAGTYIVKVTDISGVLFGYKLTTNNYNYTTTILASTQDLNANFGYSKPQVSVTKSSNISAVPAGVVGGDVIYNIEITNTGGSTIEIDNIFDDKFGDLNGVGTCKIGKTLLTQQSYSCEFIHSFSGYSAGDTHTNTVAVNAHDSEGNIAKASDNETIVFVDDNNGWAGLLIYYDANGNGAYDSGELGLDNVNIVLADKNGNTIDTTASSRYISEFGTAGLYLFSGLPAGDYIIYTNGGKPTWRVVNPVDPDGGYVYTGGSSAQIPFTMSAGQIYLNANFGFAISDISVSKYSNVNSVVPPSGDVVYSVVVENSGGVDVILDSLIDDKFGELNGKGSCILPQSISVGGSYSCSFTETISGNEGDIHTNTVTASAHDVDNNIRVDSASRDVAFSSYIIQGKSIGDSVYWDKNNNGIFDTGDEGFDNVTLELHDSADNIVATQTTSNGYYIFDNLSDDIYSVVITDTNGVLADFSLTAGTDPHTNIVIDDNHQIYFDIDFGYRKTIQVPLLNNISRMIIVFIFLFGGAFMLYRREDKPYM
jgi:fimbrial isopeptide formation D2 family protein/uncharacterized repeat protein (TIGR01451 family)